MTEPAPSTETSKIDPYELLKIKLNPDGSITRLDEFPNVPPSPTPSEPPQNALSKDLPLNPKTKTSFRLFLPHPPPSSSTKLPFIIYFHGGGFIHFRHSTLFFHEFCTSLAAHLPALVLSLDYRRSPEHRLPAAYDDALDAIKWIRTQALDPTQSDLWIRDHADFSKCFLMGNSSGGNIAYFAALRAVDLDLNPLKIVGLIMNVPFFGGAQRSESEIRQVNDLIVSLPVCDLMWALSLPEGADRDHVYCNPTAMERAYGEKIGRLPRCFINGFDGDPLVDKEKELVRILEARGVHVESHFTEGGYHAVEFFEHAMAMVLCDNVKKFVLSIV